MTRTNDAKSATDRSPSALGVAQSGETDCGSDQPPVDIARLAHELRTPLAAIAALAEIMRDERLGPLADERYRSYAADIHESAGHALAVLASYVESGARMAEPVSMSFTELDVAAEIAQAASALQPLAGRAGITLTTTRIATTTLPRLIADRRSIRQILNNLIVNAVKFTPPGGRVEIEARHHAGEPLLLVVKDTGDGFGPRDMDRVLDRFTAPDQVGPQRGGGGLGLPIVRALAIANGGTVSIESRPAKGTSVVVAFGCDRLLPV